MATASQSSHSGSVAAPYSTTQKLAKPVVHESLYVYAADKSNGGMALAEKWSMTLVQPTSGTSLSKSVRRKSFLTGVASASSPTTTPGGLLLPEAEFYTMPLENEDVSE